MDMENKANLNNNPHLCLNASYLLGREMSLLRPNLLVSLISSSMMSWSPVCFLCLLSLKFPLKMYIFISLMLWLSELRQKLHLSDSGRDY